MFSKKDSTYNTLIETNNNNVEDNSTEKLDETNLIANYLPQTMGQSELRALFASAGELESFKLVKHKPSSQSLGYGFARYSTPEDAKKAIQLLNGLRIQNKIIRVAYARPNSEAIRDANLYVKNLSKRISSDELAQLFKSFGKIICTRIIFDSSTGISKGLGFVRFDKKSEAQRAVEEMNGTVLQGMTDPLIVKFANSPRSTSKLSNPVKVPPRPLNLSSPPHNIKKHFSPLFIPSNHSPIFQYGTHLLNGGTYPMMNGTHAMNNNHMGGWCLYVYNLASEVEENVLWELFGPFGAIQQVKIMKDKTKRSKGYAFVTMLNHSDAINAIHTLNGYELCHRRLQVSFKTNKLN